MSDTNIDDKMCIARECYKAMDKTAKGLESHIGYQVLVDGIYNVYVDGVSITRSECMKKEEASQWKKLSIEKPEDDQTCLVTWIDGHGERQSIVMAYWDNYDDTFYPMTAAFNFSLKVDFWCAIPELPND